MLSYRMNGRKRIFTLGKVGHMSLEQAKGEALRRLNEIREGEDPADVRKRMSNQKTMHELCAEYIENHAKLHKKSWRQDEKRIHRTILPEFGNRRVLAITVHDEEALHKRIGAIAPYEANRTIALLRKMFELAIQWGFTEGQEYNPVKKKERSVTFLKKSLLSYGHI